MYLFSKNQKNRAGEWKAARCSARGFTIIEMIVSLSLFIFVMTITASSVLSIIDANRKSQATNTAVDNLNFVIDNMSRTLRTGKNWQVTANLPDSNKISFVPQGKDPTNPASVTSYYLNAGQIMTRVGSDPAEALTDPNLIVEVLNFYLDPQTAASASPAQPYVHVLIRAHANDRSKYRSDVYISTTISQRILNR